MEDNQDQESGTLLAESLFVDRQNMYNFMARLYYSEVSKKLMKEMHTLELAPTEGQGLLVEGYHLMRAYLKQASETALMDLAVDYTRVFIAPDRDGAYPYESVYTSENRLLMQEARDQVVEIYQRNGLKRAKQRNEPEDHLGFEMEFMAFESLAALKAQKKGNRKALVKALRAQADFLEKHLLKWVPDFARDVQRKAKTDFYKGLAMLTVGYLELDHQLIQELLLEQQDKNP